MQFGSIPTLDEVKRLEELGVSRFNIRTARIHSRCSPDTLREGLEKLENELISKF